MEIKAESRRIVSSQEFNRDIGKAKRAARDGPVSITERGRPSYVLLSIEDFQWLIGRSLASIFDLIGLEQLAADPPVAPLGELYRPADVD